MVDLSKRRLFSRKVVHDETVRLPWLSNPAAFTDLCTQCGACIKSCETNIIIKGDGGFPQVDFTRDECTFCYACAEVCPEPLFDPQTATPWHAKADIGDNCLAHSNVECRACSDMCDSLAIQFQLEIGKVAQPKLNTEQCNGCGACVAVCPTSSINVSHQTANH